MNRIKHKVNIFLDAELEAHRPGVVAFFERVTTNYDEAIRIATRYFLLVLACWLLTYAIATEWITTIDWLGVTFDARMIVAAPLLVGLLAYEMLSAMAAATILWEVVSIGLRRMLPSAWDNGLDDLLAPPTFSNVERLLEPRKPSRFSLGWFGLVTILMFGGTLVALVHTARLLLRRPVEVHWALAIVSVAVGAISWGRGVVLLRTAVEATGGFGLRHHRGSAGGREEHLVA
jgi:hypothetical protein